MTHKEEFSSEFDIYLSDILDRLSKYYSHVSVNRGRHNAKFVYLCCDLQNPSQMESVTIPNSEIEDCMKNKTLPTKIKELL